MADPGFPRRGGAQPLSLGQKLIIWQDFCRKLHENKKNLIGWGGGARPWRLLLDSPMGRVGSKFFHFHAVFGKKFAK